MIDTNHPFSVKTEFIASGDTLTEIKTTMMQLNSPSGIHRSFSHSRYPGDCHQGYLESMGGALKNGMTIVVSNWGSSWSGMNWLDQDTGCTGNCDNGPTIKIGNIRVEKAGGPTPPPTPGSG